MKKALAIFFILSLNSIVFAQNEQEKEEEIIDEVIIQESRLSSSVKNANRSIEIINRKDILNTPARTLAEMLSFVSSIDVRQRGIGGVQADINIQGGSFDQTLILIDGMSLGDPQTGHHLMNLPLDAQSIERIEIHRGSGAKIYGQNAFAGVINIVTRKNDEAFRANGGIEYGTANTLNVKGGVSGKSIFGNLGVFYNNQSSDGFRPNTDYKINNFFLKDNFKVGIQDISFMAGWTKRSFGASGFYAGPATNGFAALPIDNSTDEFEEINTYFAGITSFIEKGNFKFNSRLYARTNNDDYFFVRNTPIFNKTNSQVYTGELNASYKSSLGETGFGFTYQNTQLQSMRLDTNSRTMTAFFVEHRFSLMDNKLTINPGFTFNSYNDFGSGFFPGFDAGYWLSNSLKIYGSWNNTFRIPTYTDLYFQNGANLNNPNLIPEKSSNLDFGVKYNKSLLNLGASYFTRNGSDIIDRTKTSSTDKKWFPTNLGKLNVSGLEVSGSYSPNDFIQKVSFGATFITKVDYNKGQNVGLSRYAADQLKSQLNANVQTKIYGNFSNSLNARYFERQTKPIGAEQYYEGILLDYKLLFNTNNFNVSASINNILDKKYAESNGITMPGRWFTLGIEYKY